MVSKGGQDDLIWYEGTINNGKAKLLLILQIIIMMGENTLQIYMRTINMAIVFVV